jgi:hypothetical protein
MLNSCSWKAIDADLEGPSGNEIYSPDKLPAQRRVSSVVQPLDLHFGLIHDRNYAKGAAESG